MGKSLIEEQKNDIEILIGMVLVTTGVVLRLLPHPPNFASIAGIALFGGVYLSRRIALWLPLAAMIISDFVLGFYKPSLMMSVYASFVLCVAVGFWIKKNKQWHTVLAGSLLCSLIFFIITNFAVWAFTPWYEKTMSGLVECFTLALPFFKNTLKGDISYMVIFFGAYEAALSAVAKSIKRQLVYEKSSFNHPSSGEIP